METKRKLHTGDPQRKQKSQLPEGRENNNLSSHRSFLSQVNSLFGILYVDNVIWSLFRKQLNPILRCIYGVEKQKEEY